MRFVAAALVLHGALAVVLVRNHAPPTALAPASQEVDVDLAVDAPEPVDAPRRQTPSEPGGVPAREATPPSFARAPRAAAPSAPAGAESGAAEAPSAPSGPWAAPVFAGGAAPIDTRLPSSYFEKPERGSPPASEPHGSTTGGLREGLSEHDLALGLGSGGPTVSAAHAVGVDALVPIDGAGIFEIETDAQGRVVSVRTGDVTSDELSWRKVARALFAELARRPLRVPSGARGVAVRLRVEIIARLPSGAKAGGAVGPSTFGGGMENRSFGVRGDLSDIGASPVRTVHARVVSERSL